MKKELLNKILFERHYILAGDGLVDPAKVAYYNAFLLSNFGIEVDKPYLLTKEALETADKMLHLDVPHSFYANPQDMNYFTNEELLVEQLVSYFVVECTGNGAIDPENPQKYDRVEVFKKTLPNYVIGDEINLRKFNLVSTTIELAEILTKITKSFCDYTRPLSLDETEEFIALATDGYLKDDFKIACKETVFDLIDKTKDYSFAKYLDLKDIVKYSVSRLGENVDFSKLESAQKAVLAEVGKLIAHAHWCPMSKKQAKFYNKLLKETQTKLPKASNNASPDKKAKALLAENKVFEAAQVYAKNGSMLERNIKMLLSRATPKEAVQILDLLPAKNPVVLYQLVNGINADKASEARTFTFTKDHRVKTHVETDYETKWRKSRISEGTKKLLHDTALEKIDNHYAELPSLGKIYVADEFNNVAVPTNTSATGKGLDVLPSGSRMPITSKYIRTFVRWNGIHDVDADITGLVMDGDTVKSNKFMYFGNYSERPFGRAITFSGDDRSANGSEYYDIDLDAVKEMGYTYLVFAFHGFTSSFNIGETICGYQNKEDLKTRAWDAKNIALQFKIQGDGSACLAFAIDLVNREMIILNTMEDTRRNVISDKDFHTIFKSLSPEALEFSMGRIISHRGELVETPEEADIVFDRTYQGTKSQVVVRPYDIETLVSLVNDGTIELPKVEVVEE